MKTPIPENRSDFKQKPYGPQNRETVERSIQSFAIQLKIPIIFHQENLTIEFGDYTFTANVFQKIIRYIELGGMPGWLNGRPPIYVTEMMAQLATTHHLYFKK